MHFRHQVLLYQFARARRLTSGCTASYLYRCQCSSLESIPTALRTLIRPTYLSKLQFQLFHPALSDRRASSSVHDSGIRSSRPLFVSAVSASRFTLRRTSSSSSTYVRSSSSPFGVIFTEVCAFTAWGNGAYTLLASSGHGLSPAVLNI